MTDPSKGLSKHREQSITFWVQKQNSNASVLGLLDLTALQPLLFPPIRWPFPQSPSAPQETIYHNQPEQVTTKLFVADEISTCNSRTWLGFCRSPKRLNPGIATARHVQWPIWPNPGSPLMTCNWSCKHYCLSTRHHLRYPHNRVY